MKYLIPILILLASCSSFKKTDQSGELESKPYSDLHRPLYHFTPPAQWMNDPNGMVYYEGEYHLFYQHYPDSNVWGPMHWGHAVSEDMIKWEHLPIALYPDSLGLIFSGSAVIDWQNTSGFGTNETPPMVAVFTHHLMEGEKEKRNDFQYQSLAFSLDKGRTWTKYEGNPVIGNPGIKDFRDPKVIWHEELQKWVMVFSANDRVKFYTSPNLINWQFASDFGPDQGSPGRPWECPDIFPLTSKETGETKWVLIVSVQSEAPNGGTGTSYFIGDFDGETFTNDDPPEEILWLDYGTDNYAFVTWSDVPKEDGRRMGLGWMSNWQYAQIVPTTTWRSAMTLPRILELAQTNAGYRVRTQVVEEMNEYKKSETKLSAESALDNTAFVVEITSPSMGFNFQLTNEQGEKLIVQLSDDQLLIDRSKSGIVDFNENFPATHTAPLNDLVVENLTIYMDASSIEVFVNDGELVMTDIIFPSTPYKKLILSGEYEKATLSEIKSTIQ